MAVVCRLDRLARVRAAGKKPGPKPKLSEDQIEAVRSSVRGGQSVAAAAQAFGVSRPTIYKALEE